MAHQKDILKVEISRKTIFFTIALLIGIWFLIQIREIIIVVFLSIILLSALIKPVEWLTKRRIPRVLSVIFVYIFVVGLISVAIGVVIPPLVKQSKELGNRLPEIIASINNFFLFNNIPVEDVSVIIAKQVQQIAGDIVKVTTRIFSSILLVLTMFVLTFYSLLEWDKFVRVMASPFSGKNEEKVIGLIKKIESGLGFWLRGQIALSFIVGISVYIGLTLMGIPFAIPLAVIAAFLEIIPIIGPIIAAIPAILVGLTISPILGLAAAALYIVIQQIENNLFVPIIMSRVVGLYPPIIIIALLIGGQIAGVAGAVLAIPFIVLARIVVSELILQDRKVEGPPVED